MVSDIQQKFMKLKMIFLLATVLVATWRWPTYMILNKILELSDMELISIEQ